MGKFFSTIGIITIFAAFYFTTTGAVGLTIDTYLDDSDCFGYVGWITGAVFFCTVCYLWITGVKF